MVQDVGVGSSWVASIASVGSICLHTVHQNLHQQGRQSVTADSQVAEKV